MVKKTLLASIVTLVIASFFTVIVFAASYYISEYGDDFTQSILQSLNPCPSGWTCRDNNARKYHLVSGGGAWGVWWSAQPVQQQREWIGTHSFQTMELVQRGEQFNIG